MVTYFALDLSRSVLEEDLRKLAKGYQYVRCFGLWGSFDDGLTWSKFINTPKWFLSLGSSLGNDFFEPATKRLSWWADSMGPQDRMLLGMDAHEDIAEIWTSYHDSQGIFERFIRNGLENSNKVLGHTWYREDDWTIVGLFQEKPIMHRFAIRAKRDITYDPLGLKFSEGDEIDCYEAFKYGPDIMRQQFERVGFEELAIWKAPSAPICKSRSTCFPRRQVILMLIRWQMNTCSLSSHQIPQQLKSLPIFVLIKCIDSERTSIPTAGWGIVCQMRLSSVLE